MPGESARIRQRRTSVKVLLLHTNREHAPQPVVPMGLCLIASCLEARGHEVTMLDLCFSRSPRRDIERALRRCTPDAIGLSVRNLDNGEYLRPRAYLAQIADIARACREHSAAPVVIGGPAVSIAPRQLLERTGADYAVVGEGEQVLPELLARLAAKEPTCGLPSAWSRAQPDPALPAPERVEDLNSLPDAQPGRWLDLGRYLRWGSPLPIQTKRGCALKCIHCTYQLIEGARYRLRAPEAAVEEMEQAARQWGVRRFEIVDSTLNHPPRHALALCEAIARSGLRAELYTMGLNPTGMSRELLELMKRAGFSSVLCTPDSASEQMLATLRKGFGVEQVTRTATWAREAGLPVLWSFLFGGPGESEKTVRETVRFMDKALGPHDRILSAVGLRVYPRTELAQIVHAQGMVAPDADLTAPVFYCSPEIAPARIVELLEGSSRRSQMLYLEALQRPAIPWALRARAALGLRGPMWGAVPLYNRLARRARRSALVEPARQGLPRRAGTVRGAFNSSSGGNPHARDKDEVGPKGRRA